MKVIITDIIINERVRKELGELDGLKKSMKNEGLLNPIILTEDFELIAGYRRLECAKILKWKEIEARLLPVETRLEKLMIEANENITRKDFTDEEREEILEKIRLCQVSFWNRFKNNIKMFFQRVGDFIKAVFKKDLIPEKLKNIKIG
ncbi:MAG: ParB N-terminal domain-containing protein [Pseudomonadota bacterium]